MYSQKVLDKVNNLNYNYINEPFNVIGQSGSLDDSEVIKIYLQLENNIVKSARFRVMGNVFTIFAAEILCFLLEGQNVITFDTSILEQALLPLPPNREMSIIKVLEAYFDALQNFGDSSK